jgi:hypothetical protein
MCDLALLNRWKTTWNIKWKWMNRRAKLIYKYNNCFCCLEVIYRKVERALDACVLHAQRSAIVEATFLLAERRWSNILLEAPAGICVDKNYTTEQNLATECEMTEIANGVWVMWAVNMLQHIQSSKHSHVLCWPMQGWERPDAGGWLRGAHWHWVTEQTWQQKNMKWQKLAMVWTSRMQHATVHTAKNHYDGAILLADARSWDRICVWSAGGYFVTNWHSADRAKPEKYVITNDDCGPVPFIKTKHTCWHEATVVTRCASRWRPKTKPKRTLN